MNQIDVSMNEVVRRMTTPPKVTRPTEEEAREAVRTLLRWAGDDPDREGLRETPDRVVRAYREWFAGYDAGPGRHAAPDLRGGRGL